MCMSGKVEEAMFRRRPRCNVDEMRLLRENTFYRSPASRQFCQQLILSAMCSETCGSITGCAAMTCRILSYTNAQRCMSQDLIARSMKDRYNRTWPCPACTKFRHDDRKRVAASSYHGVRQMMGNMRVTGRSGRIKTSWVRMRRERRAL